MNTNHNQPPRHELLAGYADGELGPADRTTVEAWVAADPAALAELEAQQRLSRKNADLWQRLNPPVPSGAAWDGVLAGVKDGIMPPTLAPSYRTAKPQGMARRWSLAGVAVAALLLVLIGPS